MANPDNYIQLIKEYRQKTGVGLKEAKDMVDAQLAASAAEAPAVETPKPKKTKKPSRPIRFKKGDTVFFKDDHYSDHMSEYKVVGYDTRKKRNVIVQYGNNDYGGDVVMETLYSVKEANLIHKTQYDMDQQMFLAEFETCKEEVLAKLKASGEALKEAAAIAKKHKLKISMLKHQDILPVLSAIDAAGWSSSTISQNC